MYKETVRGERERVFKLQVPRRLVANKAGLDRVGDRAVFADGPTDALADDFGIASHKGSRQSAHQPVFGMRHGLVCGL